MNTLGYGKAYSYLELTPEKSDEGDEYKCFVDIPAQDAYFTEKLEVSFCKLILTIVQSIQIYIFVVYCQNIIYEYIWKMIIKRN